MQISINANRCEPSPMRKFHPLAVAAQKEGKRIFHLNIGQPDLPTPKAFYEAVSSFNARTLEYEASPGMPVLLGSLLDEIVVDVPDKIITLIVVFFVLKGLPNKLTALYEADAKVEHLD